MLGGKYLAESLKENYFVAVLDVFRNKLGEYLGNWEMSCGVCLIESITREWGGSLVHLDLSFNQFNSIETSKMAEALKKNNSLYGFHMEGNGNLFTDTNGFL